MDRQLNKLPTDLADLTKSYCPHLLHLHRQNATPDKIADFFGPADGGRAVLYKNTATFLAGYWSLLTRFKHENGEGFCAVDGQHHGSKLRTISSDEMKERLNSKSSWAEAVAEVRNATTRFSLATLNHALFCNPPQVGISAATESERMKLERSIVHISELLGQGNSAQFEKNTAAYLVPGLRTAEQYIWEVTELLPQIYAYHNGQQITAAQFSVAVGKLRFSMQQLAMLPMHIFTEIHSAISVLEPNRSANPKEKKVFDPSRFAFVENDPLRVTISKDAIAQAMEDAKIYSHQYALLTCPAYLAQTDNGNVISGYQRWITCVVADYLTPIGLRLGVLRGQEQ
jgi:hypothetical protein